MLADTRVLRTSSFALPLELCCCFLKSFFNSGDAVIKIALIIVRVVLSLLSLSRLIAKSLIDSGVITNFLTMIMWNAIFYVIIFIIVCTSLLYFAEFNRLGACFLMGTIFLCVTRINELLFAFYSDALSKAKADTTSKIIVETDRQTGLPEIGPRERIILISLAYVEIIFWFGILYLAIQLWSGPEAFHPKFADVREALYFSGVTITTTGYGDFLPKSNWARLAAIYQALIGIIFIALGLSAYISCKVNAEKNDQIEK